MIQVDQDAKLSEELRIGFFLTRTDEKIAALLYLVRYLIPSSQLTIIFTATKHHSEFIHSLLKVLSVLFECVYAIEIEY